MNHFTIFKRRLMIALLAIAMLAIPASGVFAQDPKTEEAKPTGDATVAFLSQYIWRGYELSRNSLVIQPSLTIGYQGFSANLWGNLDTRPYFAGPGDTSYSSTWNETDFTLSYSKTLGMFNMGGGYIYYGLGALNPDAAKRLASQEVFVSVGLNTPLSPTLTVYKEIDHYRNWYFLLGISHSFELGKVVSLKLSASASYLLSTDETTYPKCDGNALATTDKFNNFHDGNVTASLPIKVTGHITLTPTISYIFPLSEDARNEMKWFGLKGSPTASDRDSAFIYGGLTVSFSF